MSYVTNGRTLLGCAAELIGIGKIHLDVPVSVGGADLYILFGEKAFSNPLLLEASNLGSSVNELLGLGATSEKEYWLQLIHAEEWLDKVKLGAIDSRDPSDWLIYCMENGGLNHILWCLAHKRDVVSQYYWSHDMVGVGCEDLNSKLSDLAPAVSMNPTGSKGGIGFSKGSDPWAPLTRRQNFWWGFSRNFRGYPLSRRGKQPRGKSLSDKRKGNLGPRYIKEYS